ncbi:hypothetical protein I4U23_017009 [Adineta vaga]|nr:hypothetical protein I4U23_016475 [Adineta vaga]UJR12835.1 hypothetical protein I4U23_017009 [Adineta vaga]
MPVPTEFLAFPMMILSDFNGFRQNLMKSAPESCSKDRSTWVVNWSNYFPNVKQLTFKLGTPWEEKNYISPIILKNILPLERIIELDIYISDEYFEDLLQLIISLPNIQKVSLSGGGLDGMNVNYLKFDETLNTISVENKIKYVKIAIQECSYDDMKSMIRLFPRVEHLTISMCESFFIEYLLTKTIEKTPYLHLLSIFSLDSSLYKKIQTLIQSQNMPIDCLQDYYGLCHLWW